MLLVLYSVLATTVIGLRVVYFRRYDGVGGEGLHSFISLNIMVDSLVYHALHWFKYALQQCV